jgi:hypothetical protein
MIRRELRYWAGLVAAVCLAIVSAVTLPAPYDEWVLALAAVCGVVASYQITPRRVIRQQQRRAAGR